MSSLLERMILRTRAPLSAIEPLFPTRYALADGHPQAPLELAAEREAPAIAERGGRVLDHPRPQPRSLPSDVEPRSALEPDRPSSGEAETSPDAVAPSRQDAQERHTDPSRRSVTEANHVHSLPSDVGAADAEINEPRKQILLPSEVRIAPQPGESYAKSAARGRDQPLPTQHPLPELLGAKPAGTAPAVIRDLPSQTEPTRGVEPTLPNPREREASPGVVAQLRPDSLPSVVGAVDAEIDELRKQTLLPSEVRTAPQPRESYAPRGVRQRDQRQLPKQRLPPEPMEATPAGADPDVTISIGHIEVRAAPGAERPRRPAFRPRVSLDDFLNRRQGERR